MNISNLILPVSIMIALLVGVGSGYLGFIYFGQVADHCHIKYVAEEEIMELERKRVEGEKLTPGTKDLFFGDIDKAVEMTGKIARSRNNRDTKVIFSISPVFGKDVESISGEVHKEVIHDMSGRGNYGSSDLR
jgi:hypothetical protein